jgi:hypothetical protein
MLTRVKMQFAMNLALKYRLLDNDVWLPGLTVEMGSSAVLFQTADCPAPESPIEMVFHLPVPDPCDLICTGTVLRVDLPSQPGALSAIAASIERYAFVRPPKANHHSASS